MRTQRSAKIGVMWPRQQIIASGASAALVSAWPRSVPRKSLIRYLHTLCARTGQVGELCEVCGLYYHAYVYVYVSPSHSVILPCCMCMCICLLLAPVLLSPISSSHRRVLVDVIVDVIADDHPHHFYP